MRKIEMKMMIIIVFQKVKLQNLCFYYDFVYTIHICSSDLFFSKLVIYEFINKALEENV